MQEQRKEEILKNEHYVKIEIIVPSVSFKNDGSDIPYINIESPEADNITLSYLTRVLEDTSKVIIKEFNLKNSRKAIDELINTTIGFMPKE